MSFLELVSSCYDSYPFKGLSLYAYQSVVFKSHFERLIKSRNYFLSSWRISLNNEKLNRFFHEDFLEELIIRVLFNSNCYERITTRY